MLVLYFIQHEAQNITVCQFQLFLCVFQFCKGGCPVVHDHNNAGNGICKTCNVGNNVDRGTVHENHIVLSFQLV